MRHRLLNKVPSLLIPLTLAFAAGLGGTLWIDNFCNQLLALLKEQAAQHMQGTFEARKLRFTPFRNGLGLTVTLDDVLLADRRIAVHHTPLFQAEHIRATLNIKALLKGHVQVRKLKVEQGKVTVFVTKEGYTNASLFEKIPSSTVTKPTHPFQESFDKLSFQNCLVSYVDSLRGKEYAGTLRKVDTRLVQGDTSLHLELRGNILFKGLVFNRARGAFLRGQSAYTEIVLDYLPLQRRWHIHRSSLHVENPSVDRIYISGYLDTKTPPGFLSLDFHADKTSLPATLQLLPSQLERAILRRKIWPVLSAKVHLEGPLRTPVPWVTVHFNTAPFSYVLPYGRLLGIRARGHFTNRANPDLPPGDQNSVIEVPSIRGYFETIPLTGKLRIANLAQPHSRMNFTLQATPESVNALLDTSRYVVHKGSAVLKFDYEGNPVTLYNPKTDQLNGKLKGSIRLRNVSMQYLPRNLRIHELRGNVSFNENTVQVPRLEMKDGQNALLISGKIVHLPASLFGSPKPAVAQVHVKIPDWRLSWPDKLLKKNRQGSSRTSALKLSQLLDKTIDDLQITASLESNRLRYRRLEATTVRGSLVMKDRLIELKNLSMNTCGGTVKLSGGFQAFDNKQYPLFFADGQLSQANVESVFYSLGNFGQSTLTHRHLKGILSADFHFESLIKNDSAFYTPSMNGYVNVDLKKARIVNFKPMLDIKKLLFKNRALENVQFAPLQTRFVLKGEEVEVHRMKIQSNILYFFLDGVYSFGDKTNLSIQIPMSNLRRNDPNSKFLIREVEDIRGDIIFLRAIDKGGDVRIHYDTMKRFQ